MYSNKNVEDYSNILGVAPNIGVKELREAYTKKVLSLKDAEFLAPLAKKETLKKYDEAFLFLEKFHLDKENKVKKPESIDSCWETLGVPQGSSMTEIKTAFKKMVFKIHPDLHPSPENEEKFKAAYEAYQTLTGKTSQNAAQTYSFGAPIPLVHSHSSPAQEGKQDYWELLELPKSATLIDLKKAYLKKMSKLLPNKGLSPEDKQKDELLKKAYDHIYSALSAKEGKENQADDPFCDFSFSEKELKFIPKLTHSKSMGIAAIEWEKED